MSTTYAQVKSPVAYARISKDPWGAAANVGIQLRDMRAKAASLGWPSEPPGLVEIEDNDASAWNPRKVRPGYQRLLAGLDDGTWDGLLIWHNDRLHRQPKELEEFIALVARHTDSDGTSKIRIVTVTAGEYDLNTEDGRFMARIECAAASKSSGDASRRVKRKAKEIREDGRTMGGPRFFGWEANHLTARPEEKKFIERWTEASIPVLSGGLGMKWYGIAKELNRLGIPTPDMRLEYARIRYAELGRRMDTERNAAQFENMRQEREQTREEIKLREARIQHGENLWTAALIRSFIIRPRNCGKQPVIVWTTDPRTQKRKKVSTGDYMPDVEGQWEKLVEFDRWKLVPGVQQPAGASRGRYLLSSSAAGPTAFCGRPGCPGTISVTSGSAKTGQAEYGCGTCRRISRNVERADDFVIGAIAHILDSGVKIKAYKPGSGETDTATEEDGFKTRQENLRAMCRAGDISEEARDQGLDKIARELAAARGKRKARPVTATEGVTGKIFRRLPIDRQQLVIRELAEITILPAKPGSTVFDPDRISIVPRFAENQAIFEAAVARSGEEVQAVDRSRRKAVRAPQKRHEIHCAVCGKSKMAGNSRALYCGQECRRDAVKLGLTVGTWTRDKERTCIICGDEFMAAKATATICPKSSCKRANHEQRVAAGIAVPMDKVYQRRCRICREAFDTARPDALYCGKPECRKAATRDRRQGDKMTGGWKASEKWQTRTCPVCGNEYEGGGEYDTPNCRSKAWSRRKADKPIANPGSRVCARDGCTNAIGTGRAANALYCSDACKGRQYDETHRAERAGMARERRTAGV